jgi:hypothetical protein
MKDEAKAKELCAIEKPEDVRAWLSDQSVEVSPDEAKQLCDFFAKVRSGEVTKEQLEKAAEGEVSDELLESVSGGAYILTPILKLIQRLFGNK